MIQELVGSRKIKTSSGELKKGDVVGVHGKVYNLYNTDKLEVNINEIAVGLARTPRYYGDTGNLVSSLMTGKINMKVADDTMFSVAQHTVMGVRAAMFTGDLKLAKEFFVHDMPEHWLGDMKAPIKRLLGDNYKEIENKFLLKVCDHFQVEYPLSKSCDVLDQNIAEWEMSTMIHGFTFNDFWSPSKAASEIINVWNELKEMMAHSETYTASNKLALTETPKDDTLFINGLALKLGVDYTISGNTVTFTESYINNRIPGENTI
jgi:hypothetical protein